METRLHLIVVWFHWKQRTRKEGNCYGRSQVRRILLTCIQLLLLQFLHVIWSMPTIFAFFKKPLDKFFCLLSSVRCICACASYTDHRLKLTWLEKGINMFATIRVTFNFGSIMMKGKTRENVMTISVQVNPSFIYHSPVKYGWMSGGIKLPHVLVM